MPDLKKPNVPAKMTWSEATYKQTLRLGQMMEPLKLLAEQSQDTHQPGPVSALIEAAPPVWRDRPPDDREVRQDHTIAGGAVDSECAAGHDEGLIQSANFRISLGLAAHTPALTEILALASRNALSQDERVVVEFGAIEDEARFAKSMIDALPREPETLIEARKRVVTARNRVEAMEASADQALQAMNNVQRPRPWWRRTIGYFSGENARHSRSISAARLAAENAKSALHQARNERLSEESRLAVAFQQHQERTREHIEKWTKQAAFAEERLAAVVQAKELLKRLPGAAALGPAGLFELGRRLATEKQLRLSRPRDSGEARLCTQP